MYTTYYVRAYAINAYGISYGEEKSFNTSAYPQQIDGIPSERYEVVISDDFNNNNNGWYIHSDHYVHFIISNGFYDIQSFSENVFWSNNEISYIIPKNDFEIEVVFKIVPLGISENEVGGFIWNIYYNNFSAIFLTRNNNLWFGEHQQTWETWNYFSSLSALNPAGELNKYTLRKFNAVYYFFINDQYLFSYTCKPFTYMNIGFYIQCYGKILIDYFKASKISLSNNS